MGGARKVARCRFEESEDEEELRGREGGSSSSSLQKLQRNKIFRTCVFVFGTLPQTVKLYAMSGIFWTKVLGFMFVGFFVILEVIVEYLAEEFENLPRDEIANMDDGRIRSFDLLTQAANLTFSFYYFGLRFYKAVENITDSSSLLKFDDLWGFCDIGKFVHYDRCEQTRARAILGTLREY